MKLSRIALACLVANPLMAAYCGAGIQEPATTYQYITPSKAITISPDAIRYRQGYPVIVKVNGITVPNTDLPRYPE